MDWRTRQRLVCVVFKRNGRGGSRMFRQASRNHRVDRQNLLFVRKGL